MFVLNLDDEKRILSAWDKLPSADYGDRPIVDALPDGNLYDYRYVEEEFVYDPLPEPEQPEQAQTPEERIKQLEDKLKAAEILLGLEEE